MQTYSEDYRLWKKYAHSRPGMRMVGIVRVAVPITLVSVDVVAQEQKPLDLLDEFVLRMVDAGLTTIRQISQLCGLNEDLVSNVTISQVADGSLQYLPHTDSFELTPMGDKLVDELVEIKPVLSEFPVTFDRLAWTVSDYPRSSLVTKSDAASDCRTLLPYARKGLLGPAEVSPAALNSVIKFKGRKELTVLEVRKIKFRNYRYLPADLLIFQGDTNEDTSAALVIEGELSQRQDLALAKWSTQELVNIRLDKPTDVQGEGGTRHPLDEKHPIFSGELAEETSAADARNFQHHELLHRSLSTAQEHIVISTVRVSRAVVDDHFCRLLESTLRRRVIVDILFNADTEVPHERQAVNRLTELQKRHRNLRIYPIAGHNEEMLTFDGWQVTGSFPWLNHRSHPQQVLRDYTSVVRRISASTSR